MPGQTGHSDRALRSVRFCFSIFFSSSYSLSVSLSLSAGLCLDFSQFQGPFCGVESCWKKNRQRQCRRNHQDLGLAVWRLPVDAASTCNLQTASPKSWWCCPRRWQFAFHRGSTPMNGPWNCEKSAHESTEWERKKMKKHTISSALSASITVDTQNECFWIFYISIFRGHTHLKKLPFRVVAHTGHSQTGTWLILLFFEHID